MKDRKILHDEQTEIHAEIVSRIIEATPEWWDSAILELRSGKCRMVCGNVTISFLVQNILLIKLKRQVGCLMLLIT